MLYSWLMLSDYLTVPRPPGDTILIINGILFAVLPWFLWFIVKIFSPKGSFVMGYLIGVVGIVLNFPYAWVVLFNTTYKDAFFIGGRQTILHLASFLFPMLSLIGLLFYQRWQSLDSEGF